MLQYLGLVLVVLDQLLLLCALTFQDAVKRSDGLKQENQLSPKRATEAIISFSRGKNCYAPPSGNIQ